jgi:ADP-ribosyl-[dinitrogen reductase] hydrolase
MHYGSCHCKAVRFEIGSEIYGFKHCHCHTCRKIHGTVYGSSALTSASGFRLLEGNAQLQRYESSPGKRRCFCGNCGSHLFAYYEQDPEIIVLRLGTVDELEAIRPVAHIWVSEKAPWYSLCDEVPQFQQDLVEPEPT